MDYSFIKDFLREEVSPNNIDYYLRNARESESQNATFEVYSFCLSVLDVTSLNVTDSPDSIERFTNKIAQLRCEFPHLPSPSTICVYPSFVEVVGLILGDSEIGITSVAGGFPASHTFLEVGVLEVSMAEESGADEIDVVINVGELLEGHDEVVISELEVLRHELSPSTIMKVIIESGILPDYNTIRRAALLAMVAGADFIKTSTGKNGQGATPEAVAVMCCAIRDYAAYSGEKIGLKIAGGVNTTQQAIEYYSIVKEILGDEWLTPELFRIGASKLLNSLLSSAEGREINFI